MRKRLEQLVNEIEIFRAFIRANPSSKLKEMAEVIGEDKVAVLMRKYAGRTIQFPTLSTQNRFSIVAYVTRELRYERKGAVYEKRVEKLARLYRKTKNSIKLIHETKTYHE
ncbi:MAG: hypothetical protein OEZ31_09950 [Nitrospirota bacterium]|nr:hypothetical protein [Candidatus Aminicenantes bacterium]MDH5203371.1 hypothetical protein [Nitrospirota bacterium]MDH5769262.1 hypothetical protein [Nitrospirota bacterium]